MRRVIELLAGLAACAAVASASLTISAPALAEDGRRITVTIQDLNNPPEYQPNRCANAPYTTHQSEGLETYRNSTKMVSTDDSIGFQRRYSDMVWVTDLNPSTTQTEEDKGRWISRETSSGSTLSLVDDTMAGFDPEEQMYRTWCEAGVDTDDGVKAGDVEPGSLREFWVPMVTEDILVGYLYLQLSRYLYGPDFTWKDIRNRDGEPDPNGDAIIVKVPWVVTVADTGPITVQASASNLATPQLVTASITASPERFILDGGDPEVDPVDCSFEQVDAEQCTYEYYHSSISLSADGRPYQFATRGVILWDVTTTANTVNTGTFSPATSSNSTLFVGEIQAVVTG